MVAIEHDPRAARAAAADVERSATPAGRRVTGRLVVEGTRLHERALRAGRTPDRVLAGRSLLDRPTAREAALLGSLAAAGTRILPVDDAEIARLNDGRGGGAVVGLVPIPASCAPAAMLAAAPPPAVLVLLAGIDDPGNVGALARTALAAGAAGVVAAAPADPFHPRAVRTSMGAVLKIAIAIADDAGAAIDDLRASGVRVIAAVSDGGTALPRFDWGPGPVAVALGSEAFGLDPAILARADARTTVPMAGTVDSFSVNAAAAVLLYEAIARRRGGR